MFAAHQWENSCRYPLKQAGLTMASMSFGRASKAYVSKAVIVHYDFYRFLVLHGIIMLDEKNASAHFKHATMRPPVVLATKKKGSKSRTQSRAIGDFASSVWSDVMKI